MRIDLDQINDVASIAGRFKGLWASDIPYKAGEAVVQDNTLYTAVEDSLGVSPATNVAADMWSVLIEQTPFIFQVGEDTSGAEHYHLAKMPVSMARQLVAKTIPSATLESESLNGHEHTLTIIYDFDKHTFVVTNVTSVNGNTHAAYFIGGGGGVSDPIEISLDDIRVLAGTSKLVPGQKYRINQRNNAVGMNGVVIVEAHSTSVLNHQAVLDTKVPDYNTMNVWRYDDFAPEEEEYVAYTFTASSEAYTAILPDETSDVQLLRESYQTVDMGFLFDTGILSNTLTVVDYSGFGIGNLNGYLFGDYQDAQVNPYQAYSVGYAPNRKFVVRFVNNSLLYNPSNTFSGQVVFEETTNRIIIGIESIAGMDGLYPTFDNDGYSYGLEDGNTAGRQTVYTPVPQEEEEETETVIPPTFVIYDGLSWSLNTTSGVAMDIPGLTSSWQTYTAANADGYGNTVQVYHPVVYSLLDDAIYQREDTSGNLVKGASAVSYFPWGNFRFRNNRFDGTLLNATMLNADATAGYVNNYVKGSNMLGFLIRNASFEDNEVFNADLSDMAPASFSNNRIHYGLNKYLSYYNNRFYVNSSEVPMDAPAVATTYSSGVVRVGRGLTADYQGVLSITPSRTITYVNNQPPDYTERNIYQVGNSDFGTHDLIEIQGVFGILYLKNINYNIRAYNAVVNGNVWIGDNAAPISVNMEGITVKGNFYVHESFENGASNGHLVTITNAKLNNITPWQLNSGGYRDSHTFNNCSIGYVARGAAYNGTPGHKIVLNNCIIGRDIDGGAVASTYLFDNYGEDSCSVVVRNSILIVDAGRLVDRGVSVYPYITYTNCTVVRPDGTTYRLDNSGDALATDGTDLYDVSDVIREAVVLGSYNESNEMTAAVTGSLSGMSFSYEGFHYEYMPGDAGTLVWIKTNRLGGGGGTGGDGDGVTSLNGETGDLFLDATTLGLDAVDNTHDIDKPISTATQNALDVLTTADSDLSTAITGITDYVYDLETAIYSDLEEYSDYGGRIQATENTIDEITGSRVYALDNATLDLIESRLGNMTVTSGTVEYPHDNVDDLDLVQSNFGFIDVVSLNRSFYTYQFIPFALTIYAINGNGHQFHVSLEDFTIYAKKIQNIIFRNDIEYDTTSSVGTVIAPVSGGTLDMFNVEFTHSTWLQGVAGETIVLRECKVKNLKVTGGVTVVVGKGTKLTGAAPILEDGSILLDENLPVGATNHPPVGFTGIVAPYYYRTQYIDSYYTHIAGGNGNRVVSEYDAGSSFAFLNFRTPNGTGCAYGEYVSPGQIFHLKPLWCNEIRYFTRHDLFAQNRKISVRRMSDPNTIIEEVIVYANGAKLPAGGLDHWTPDKTFYLPSYDSYMVVLENIETTNPDTGEACIFYYHGDFIIN